MPQMEKPVDLEKAFAHTFGWDCVLTIWTKQQQQTEQQQNAHFQNLLKKCVWKQLRVTWQGATCAGRRRLRYFHIQIPSTLDWEQQENTAMCYDLKQKWGEELPGAKTNIPLWTMDCHNDCHNWAYSEEKAATTRTVSAAGNTSCALMRHFGRLSVLTSM